MPREVGQPGQRSATTIRESDLKICELCGWLNLDENDECFVCGWHGRFVRDPAVVRAAFELAVREHGRLELQDLTDLSTNHRANCGKLKLAFNCMRDLIMRFFVRKPHNGI